MLARVSVPGSIDPVVWHNGLEFGPSQGAACVNTSPIGTKIGGDGLWDHRSKWTPELFPGPRFTMFLDHF